jgi:hypothetical protein
VASTEADAKCGNYDEERRPFFGDLHVHTKYSVDAVIFGTQNGPHEAYAFGRGRRLDLGPITDGTPANTTQLARPLDFLGVTDHSEGFGLANICYTPGTTGYDSPECSVLRNDGPVALPANIPFLAAAAAVISPTPTGPATCLLPGVNCPAAAATIWQDEQAAAAEANDPCTFTSFVAYEWTATPFGANLHRNVIFRNEHVPAAPVTYTDTGMPDHTKLWSQLQSACKDGVPGCDVITIPHNSNVSAGLMFQDPKDAQEASDRQIWEPLVEVAQHKGVSECHFDKKFGSGVDTTDEMCAFEQVPDLLLITPAQLPDAAAPPPAELSPRSFIRSTLKAGLQIAQAGEVDTANPTQLAHINPFKFGFIGSTDTHNATPGNTEEQGWVGHLASMDATKESRVSSLNAIARNPGGLAVVWAEQNTRNSIFDALRRRETYATSGTRPTVRFFGGWNLDPKLCGDPALVKTAYQNGVPMGADLPTAPAGSGAPTFLTWALQDAGSDALPGVPLQRIQIVKGWVDSSGQTHEQVYDVAPNSPSTSTAVDPQTCSAEVTGEAELCSVWRDPAFDKTQAAFYYARVLEDPKCRWSVADCRAVGVDPFAASCDTSSSNPYNECCASNIDPVIQDRAWASPIWYRPAS